MQKRLSSLQPAAGIDTKGVDHIRIETNTVLTVTEAGKDFTRATQLAEKNGRMVIFENERPRYLLIDLDTVPELSDDERIDIAAAGILKRFKPAFEELAK